MRNGPRYGYEALWRLSQLLLGVAVILLGVKTNAQDRRIEALESAAQQEPTP